MTDKIFGPLHQFRSVALVLCMVITLMVTEATAFAAAGGKFFTLGVKNEDWPPYLIPSNTQKPGLIIEICRHISERLGVELTLKPLPDQRGPLMLAEGQIDAWPKALEWMDELNWNRQDYYWSDPLINVSDILISNATRPYDRLDQLRQKDVKIGAMLGYGYPFLHDHFLAYPQSRIDLSSETIQLEMLKRKRVAAVVMNKLTYYWLLKYQSLNAEQFHVMPQQFDAVGYRLIFSRRSITPEFVKSFNAELMRLRNAGGLQEILAAYGAVH